MTKGEIAYNKQNIIFNLINYEANKEELLSRPHIRFYDLAIVFGYYAKSDINIFTNVDITNEISQFIKLDQAELFKIAYKNTQNLFNVHFQLLTNVESSEPPVYLLTTEKIQRNGSFFLLYREVLEKISTDIENSFYIIPSSIDELIIIPYNEQMNINDLLKYFGIVALTTEDLFYLSDKVYYFDKDKKELFLKN